MGLNGEFFQQNFRPETIEVESFFEGYEVDRNGNM